MFAFLKIDALFREAFPVAVMPNHLLTIDDMRANLCARNEHIAWVYDLNGTENSTDDNITYGDIPLRTITGITHALIREYLAPIERMVNGEQRYDDQNAHDRVLRLQTKYHAMRSDAFFRGISQYIRPEDIEIITSCIDESAAIQNLESLGESADKVLYEQSEDSICAIKPLPLSDVLETLGNFASAVNQLTILYPDLEHYADHLSEVTNYYHDQAIIWAEELGLQKDVEKLARLMQPGIFPIGHYRHQKPGPR